MNIDLDQLKQKWQGLDSLTPSQQANDMANEPLRHINASRSRSSLRRIERLYGWLTILSAMWVILFPLFIHELGLSPYIGAWGAVFFLVAGLHTYRIYRHTRTIDIGDMTVVQALSATCRLQQLRRSTLITNLILATPLVVIMLWQFHSASAPMFYGGLAGVIIGLAIGVANARKTSRWISSVRRELNEIIC